MTSTERSPDLVLGLDLGTNSVGWALIRCERERPVAIEAAGVRVFDPGKQGLNTKDEASPAAGRREKRGSRRLTARRRRRMRRVYGILAGADLLPSVDTSDAAAVHAAIEEVDRDLASRDAERDDVVEQTRYYRLRARALDESLTARELGRALYHLAQRRGFKSNRRADRARDDKEAGKVKAGISELQLAMEEQGARTLGEYFAHLDPHHHRIRGRYTDRSMYRAEFEAIREAQGPHHPDLDEHFWGDLETAIFHQRPLRSTSHLIGRCSLEPGRPRAPLYSDRAQRARILQEVNHLAYSRNGGPWHSLDASQRAALIESLQRARKLTWAKVAKEVGLKRKEVEFNLEEGGRRHLDGHVVADALAPLIGWPTWHGWTSDERDCLAQLFDTVESPEALRRVLRERYGLSGDALELAMSANVPEGRSRHSTRALRRILPHLEEGLSYSEALDLVYPERRDAAEPRAQLSPVSESLSGLRNPIVERTLTELRKVVNELLVRWGRPSIIRIEMARDLKKGKKVRDEIAKRARTREKERKAAKEKLLGWRPDRQPSRGDVERILLAEECGWRCPYTGRGFGMADLVGSTPTVEVEHIVPFSVSLDNSFANKTLCDVAENRRKGNSTPAELYEHDDDRFEEVLGRVRDFEGAPGMRRAKEARFRMTREDFDTGGGFASRQLADTAYIAKLAVEYLGQLYGGAVDGDGRRRVHATSGRATAFLRAAWGASGLLDGGGATPGLKTRSDHRHHAVDAVVVALTDARAVQQLSRAAQRAEERALDRLFMDMERPWDRFLEDLDASIRGIHVSHRVRRQVNGPLHEETIYSVRDGALESDKGYTRKMANKVTPKDAKTIRDPILREAVLEWLGAGRHGDGPTLRGRDGAGRDVERVVRHVRVAGSATMKSLQRIGSGPGQRWVKPGSNHHAEVFEIVPGRKWRVRTVRRLDAMTRVREGRPAIDRTSEEGRFLFSLHPGDTLGRRVDGMWELVRVSSIGGQWEGLLANDARPATEVRDAGASGGRIQRAPSTLLRDGYAKVDVSAAGFVSRNNE